MVLQKDFKTEALGFTQMSAGFLSVVTQSREEPRLGSRCTEGQGKVGPCIPRANLAVVDLTLWFQDGG